MENGGLLLYELLGSKLCFNFKLDVCVSKNDVRYRKLFSDVSSPLSLSLSPMSSTRQNDRKIPFLSMRRETTTQQNVRN